MRVLVEGDAHLQVLPGHGGLQDFQAALRQRHPDRPHLRLRQHPPAPRPSVHLPLRARTAALFMMHVRIVVPVPPTTPPSQSLSPKTSIHSSVQAGARQSTPR